jgi:hypothetical protein
MYAVGAVCCLILGFTIGHEFLISFAVFALVALFDRVRLKYKLNPDAQAASDSFVESFKQAASSERVWMIDHRGHVSNSYQQRTNAGKDTVIHTEHASATTRARDFVVNLPVPTLKASGRSPYFLPDTIIVQYGRRFAELAYHDVSVISQTLRTTEHGPVPEDAQQVGMTWTHVNKDDGPDHRFKTNPTVPILLYDEVVFSNKAREFESEWQFSRTGSVTEWVAKLHARGATDES